MFKFQRTRKDTEHILIQSGLASCVIVLYLAIPFSTIGSAFQAIKHVWFSWRSGFCFEWAS